VISRLWRYLFVQSFLGIAAATAVIAAVIMLVDFVETSRDVATRAEVTALQTVFLTMLKTPNLIQQSLPFIVLFGVLFTFFRLSRQSELIVLRASGYSPWRILAPVVMLSLTAGIAGMTMISPLGAATNAHFESTRAEIMRSPLHDNTPDERPVWLRETSRDGFVIITASRLDPELSAIENPTFRIYLLRGGGAPVLERRVTADRAVLAGGFWSLTNASEAQPGDAAQQLGSIAIPANVGRQALFERVRSPGGLSFWRLPSVIETARDAGLSSRAYELRWYSLLSLPLFLVAAALIAVAATLRLHRQGGAAKFAAVGVITGFLLYFSQELLLSLGASGALDPVTAAWTTPVLFALAGLFFISATEDG